MNPMSSLTGHSGSLAEFNGTDDLTNNDATLGANVRGRERRSAHEPGNPLGIEEVPPWPEAVEGAALLNELRDVMARYVVLPKWAAKTLALWTVHTYAFELRSVTTYIGISSPEKRCGKTTLLELLGMLVNRPLAAANISPPALFRAIEEARPTLLIDEADTFLHGNEELRGILNSGYTRKLAYVVRVTATHNGERDTRSTETDRRDAPGGAGLRRFSCWCPKALAAIGRLPDTLMDRSVVITMQRKTARETVERLRDLEPEVLRRKCARFVRDHARAIAAARPTVPSGLNDRAADIWEPLLALADLAGGDWPRVARDAAVNVSAQGQENHYVGALLLDIMLVFLEIKAERMFSRELVAELNAFEDSPWNEARKGKEIDELWLAQQLRPYGLRSRTIWIGDKAAKGYLYKELEPLFQRYISRADVDAMMELVKPKGAPPQAPGSNGAEARNSEGSQGNTAPEIAGL